MTNQNNRTGDGAGAGMGFRGGKGKPGYPLPDDMKNDLEPTETGVLERSVDDIVAKIISMDGIVNSSSDKGVVKRSTPLDLVVWNTINGMIGEADDPSPKDLPKGIAHMEDMKPEQFLSFLEKYKDLPLKGGLEVSEKVDGSARISFGVDNGKVWTQSKNGPRMTSAAQYGDKPMFRALRAAHEALSSKERQIAASWPKDVAFMVAEVLFTKIPNSIEYGPNVIMIHGVHKNDGSTVPEAEGKKLATDVTSSAGGKLNDGKDDWKFEYKRIISPEDVMVDVKNEYDSVKQIYDELKQLEPNRLKAVGKVPYKAAMEKFRAVQVALKKKLVGQLRKQKSIYGPEGGDVEGIVFRDLESGELTKLVDKEYFTKLNKFLWHYRELLDKGVKVGDKWEFGIMQKFRNAIADKVMGSPVAKTPGFVNQLKKFGADLKFPAGANTPEKKADYTISQYIKKNNLMQGDFVGSFTKELRGVRDEFDKLKAEWDSKKKGELVHQIKDDEGNVIKTVKMDPLIKGRTDESFKGMEEFLDGVAKSLESVQKMRGELTKKTALLKLMLGQNRFEKLAGLGGADEGEPKEESVSEASNVSLRDPGDVLKAFSGKLLNRKIDVSNARELGSGHNGTAYEVGGGKVLKITQDPYEARASNHLIGKKLKHVVQFYDVFKFPAQQTLKGRGPLPWYGILEEKVDELSEHDKTEFEHARLFVTRHFADLKNFSSVDNMWTVPWKEIRTRVLNNATEMEDVPEAEEALGTLERLGLPDVLDELKKNQVQYRDVHVGNFMMRGKDLVVIDLGGASKSPGGEPPVLEKIVDGVLEALSEARADKVGVTIGRFQPFHRGHAAVIRDLARKFNKVIVVVAGNSKDKKNPFSFDLRTEMMKKSLPDVMSKVEIHKATYGGKNSGYIPGVLSDIVKDKRSSLEADVAVHVLVGMDRVEDLKKQMEHAKGAKEQGTELFFDPSMAIVQALPDVKNDDEADRVSGTRVREALAKDDRETVKVMLDPHLASNPSDFEDVYAKLKVEFGGKASVKEAVGGVAQLDERDIEDSLDTNSQALAKHGINSSKLHKLGAGTDGIAYDMGGKKVLKVTTNEAEAGSSSLIMKKGGASKHLVKVFDVFRFRPETVTGKGELYGIVTDLLTPLSKQEKEEVDKISAFWLDPDVKAKVTPFVRSGDYNGMLKAVGQILFELEAKGEGANIGESSEVTSEAGGDVTAVGRVSRGTPFKPVSKPTKMQKTQAVDPANARAEADRKLKILDAKYKKFNLPDMFKELKALGIQFTDYHSDNLMKRGSTYVINDIGRSEGGLKGSAIPQLENIVDTVAEKVLNEIGAFTGMGGSMVGTKAGTSAWSAANNRVDPDSKELWQNQLNRLEIRGSGALPENVEEGNLYEAIAWKNWNPSNKTPFDTHELPPEKRVKGTGGGEVKLVDDPDSPLYGGQVQGGRVAYDIVKDGKKWEVKEIKKDSEELRIGTEGSVFVSKFKRKLDDAVEQLVSFLQEHDDPETNKQLASIGLDHDKTLKMVEAMQKYFEKMEYSKGIMVGGTTKNKEGFLQILQRIGKLGKTMQTGKSTSASSSKRAQYSYDTEKMVDMPQLGKGVKVPATALALFAKKLGLPYEGLGLAKQDVARGYLTHEYFKDPKKFEEDWATVAKPSSLFPGIEGLVLVNKEKGYYIIPKANLDDELEFVRITKGSVKLRVKK